MPIINRGGYRTAECVSPGHPDKYMDRLADAILDEIISKDASLTVAECKKAGCRVAIEGVAKDNLVVLAGEVTFGKHARDMRLDFRKTARDVWRKTGYGPGDDLIVLNHIQTQSPELNQAQNEFNGAGDQGIMVGYATDETESMLPLEYLLARQLVSRMIICRESKHDPNAADADRIPWLQPDGKSQVTLDGDGRVQRVVVAVQHDDLPELVNDLGNIRVLTDQAIDVIKQKIVYPVIGEYIPNGMKLEEVPVTVNGAGCFAIGGPPGDAGEVGRKIVVDAYGPRVPVGGGAYSGKDPTKVDRSGAYMARHVAKAVVAHKIGGANECLVHIAYGIGKMEPEMITAFTDSGKDVGEWAQANFKFSPWSVIEHLGLWHPEGWSFEELSTYGHYGRENYPWERVK
jgi:S-adenosylmethionine synthetase